MWTRTLTILAMLIFMILAMLIMMMLASGWALVRVVLDVVPMLNRWRPLVSGQCQRRLLARIVRIANLQVITGYGMMLGACAAWAEDLAMMLEDWASGGDGIHDSKVDYLIRVLVPWIVKHVADKVDYHPRLPPFVTWLHMDDMTGCV